MTRDRRVAPCCWFLLGATVCVFSGSSNTAASAFTSPTIIPKHQPPALRRLTTSVHNSVAAAAPTVNGAAVANGAVSSSNSNPSIRLNVNEQARTVTSVCTSGTHCTLSSHAGIEGAPFGSLVDYVLDDQGCPVLLMNDMSMHTINIQQAIIANMEQQASSATTKPSSAWVTLFTQLGSSSNTLSNSQSSNSKNTQQDVSRCSLTGTLEKLSASTADDWELLRLRYSLAHSYADQVLDSPRFSMYRLVPHKIYYVGGFGVLAKWVDPVDYRLASPDILAKEAASIVQKMNQPDHLEDLLLTVKHVLGVSEEVEQLRVTNVDRLGMDVRVTTQAGRRRNKLETNEYRIGFRIPVRSVEDAKSEILKVFQEAWETANGYVWDDDQGETVPFVKIAADGLE
jgi:putative heme iron utilization protein